MAANLGPTAGFLGSIFTGGTQAGLGKTPSTTLFFQTRDGFLYELDFASRRACEFAQNRGSQLSREIWVYTAEILREDARQFFAFNTFEERVLFSQILSVKDVGPKTAATLVAELGASGLLRLMQEGTWKGLKIPGVGPKTWDSIRFGLEKKEKILLPLLRGLMATSGSSEPEPSRATGSRAASESTVTKVTTGSDSQQGQSETQDVFSGTWKPRTFASDSLISMFENLGMDNRQAQELFELSLKEIKGFEKMSDVQRVPLMLRLYGRSRRNNTEV